MDEDLKREVLKLIREETQRAKMAATSQVEVIRQAIKQRHIEDKVIRFGLAADRPTDDTRGTFAYFSTDTNILSIYDGTEWVTFARIPASPSAYTQTYSTADRTHAASTFAAVAETGVTQTTPFGFATAAQGDAISVELNDLGDDVIDLKQLVNALVDDLQSIGLIS